jgi:hypothetical protein
MNKQHRIIILILLGTAFVGEGLAATLDVKLSVQLSNFTNGPENMGIGLVGYFIVFLSFLKRELDFADVSDLSCCTA